MQKQARNSTGTKGRYLYAIVADSEQKSYSGLGLFGGRVYTIVDGSIAAVVSDVPNQKIRPERRHFAAHQGVLRLVMAESDLLPMSFGIISESAKAVQRILAANREAIRGQLGRVSGKVEMGLKVSWDVPNIFEYMVTIHPDLMEARDRLKDPLNRPSHEDKIEIGQLFEELLDSDREQHTSLVEDILRPNCAEMVRNKCRDESMVMNLACLVGRDSISEFESGVLEAAGHFDDCFAFDFNGPWAPHNFVELQIEV
ncbi:MAG: GvpL/GvpF family gas vesicle protein [Pseudomonadota bacterium]